MKQRLQNFLGVEANEVGPVTILLIMSFFMGLFLATVLVASQSQYLAVFDEATDLPYDLMFAGLTALGVSFVYNFFVGRVNFSAISIFFLGVLIVATLFLQFGIDYVPNKEALFQYGFRFVMSFTFVCNLIFWGAFNRLFNLRQIKRVIGSVDVGMDIASIIAFFSIPFLLQYQVLTTTQLYSVGLLSIIGFLVFFIILSVGYLNTKAAKAAFVEKEHKKMGIVSVLTSKYMIFMTLFIIMSFSALRFIDYSFFNVSTERFTSQEDLGSFLAAFEGTIVIFGFAFTTFATDKIQSDYGLRVSLIINPMLVLLFTIGAAFLGYFFGYSKALVGENSLYFFLAIAMSKLFLNSLRDALDTPIFKQYYIPIDKEYRVDATAKIEGIITALAAAVGGGLIVLINQVELFQEYKLYAITLCTIPVLILWYFVINQMYKAYRQTLNDSLVKNRAAVAKEVIKEFTVDAILEKEAQGSVEDKVIYGLKLMEKLQPAMFENSLLQLADSNQGKVKQFAIQKIDALGLTKDSTESEMKGLALKAVGASEDSEMLSIAPDKLMKLSKSVKQADRILAVKMLRTLISPKTIFILLELLRDADPKVRHEALITARKVKRPETWPVLIEMISSPTYGHHAIAALKEAGEAVLQSLEAAFHKSGQTDVIMMKLVQIMGHIGGREGMEMLWKKIDYPDKRIVKQIIYTLRYINYRASGKEAREIIMLLDVEIGKTLWNLAALEELGDEEHFVQLKDAIREEIRDNYTQISLLMSLLYDPQSVQLVKDNVESGTPDGIAYALELMELFVDADLKPKLYPLFDDTTVNDKLEVLQTYFPRENYQPIQVINYIINRDFNYNNRWSKVCAVHASAYMNDFRVSRGLISQMFNNDKLLQETSAWVIFNKDKVYYQELTTRLPLRDKRFLDASIENNQLLDGLDDGFFLGIEIVFFLKELAIFKGIGGSVLSDLADKVIPIELNTRDKIVLNNVDELPIIICAHGEVRLKNGNDLVATYKKGGYYGELFQESAAPRITEVEATERSVVFRINLVDFYYVMANHQELISGLIRNVTVKEEEEIKENE
jgi:ATP:ADP antiporter, AAA family